MPPASPFVALLSASNGFWVSWTRYHHPSSPKQDGGGGQQPGQGQQQANPYPSRAAIALLEAMQAEVQNPHQSQALGAGDGAPEDLRRTLAEVAQRTRPGTRPAQLLQRAGRAMASSAGYWPTRPSYAACSWPSTMRRDRHCGPSLKKSKYAKAKAVAVVMTTHRRKAISKGSRRMAISHHHQPMTCSRVKTMHLMVMTVPTAAPIASLTAAVRAAQVAVTPMPLTRKKP